MNTVDLAWLLDMIKVSWKANSQIVICPCCIALFCLLQWCQFNLIMLQQTVEVHVIVKWRWQLSKGWAAACNLLKWGSIQLVCRANWKLAYMIKASKTFFACYSSSCNSNKLLQHVWLSSKSNKHSEGWAAACNQYQRILVPCCLLQDIT